jgi:glycosyltransferase involved in cell wall biosynthesis
MSKPIRVLHVLGRLNPGGVEVWLRHVLRHIDRERYRMDFLVLNEAPGAYDEEFRALGAKVIPCGGHSRPWVFARRFREVLRTYGPYDVVHSHVHHYSGVVLAVAAAAGVPVRLAHSHSDPDGFGHERKASRRAYRMLMAVMLDRAATGGMACSRPAARSLFGRDWASDPRWGVVYCGVDLEPFHVPQEPGIVRQALSIPPDDLVLGHVGGFKEVKNHTFLLKVFAAFLEKEPRGRLVLVGEGPLRQEIEAEARWAGLEERTHFLGARDDVPALLAGGFDAFVFPSLYEGLGLSLVEAQAAGLPCIYSDVVTEEAAIVPELMRPLSLKAPPDRWASEAQEAIQAVRSLDRVAALMRVSESQFNIQEGLRTLLAWYASADRGERGQGRGKPQ